MEIRLTTNNDLDEVMEIYRKARLFMRAHDNPTQWLGGKPTKEQIEEDIAKKLDTMKEDMTNAVIAKDKKLQAEGIQ